ncbi:uncharacterized protein TM35_000211760 [Trypanosoma theileri]|uniref:Uncharacterized protein n=1 Tax=Trypanosoma theileri TaxID=67003 RepID=A0A1X0NTZ3_9TRYP|nr:uncharacterized protein TM35_000211760 [Trypanosoma theileri]ORC87570.1 hypothetical protein TM35_000211760 [Trypanosoma theileri]
MRVPTSGCGTNSASLRRDIERFIHPLARSLRQKHPAALAAIATSVSSVNKQSDVCKPKNESDMSLYGRTPGIRESVTYFSTRMNALLNRPLESINSIDVTMPLYRCPICCSVAPHSGPQPPWMTPLEITRHMSWLHAFNGSTQSSFAEYNAREMKRIFKALPSCTHSRDVVKTALPLARVVVMLDVANIELSTEDILFELLGNEESLRFFRRVPCAFVCVHEVFIPHTSRPGHTFFQLSRLHPHSDMFTVYAATRSESGDFVSAALMGELLLQSMRGCGPPIVLLTKDRVQKLCVAETFGGVVGKGGRVFLPRITTASILNSLREANNASMG